MDGENKLYIEGGSKTIDEKDAVFNWPIVTSELEEIVSDQLHKTISIYNKSGIFAEFENKFAAYHDSTKHALLNNSGTSAIMAMFEGLDLEIGDEIICPVYTFFATISPAIHLGLKPVFVDALEDGNIDPAKIKAKITPKTKAVIVTHMWGMPCQMDKIVEICKQHNLYLLEDCSHAHGATFNNKKVGTFGDASAWSLQGQKIITGGEGGILLTNNDEIYYRANLLGHYNKRCKDEIPKDNPLSAYAITGFGLKLRAHPIAIAIANHQFNYLDSWIEQKNEFASQIISKLSGIGFLKMPETVNKKPSWYGFVMQYLPHKANQVSINQFVKVLHAEGLVEVDLPGSTSPLDKLPLFQNPAKASKRLGGLFPEEIEAHEQYPTAYNFYKNAIKIPIWVNSSDQWKIEKYIEGFKKVAYKLQTQPELFYNL